MKDKLQQNIQQSECQRNVLEKLLQKSQDELMEIKKEMENLLVVLNVINYKNMLIKIFYFSFSLFTHHNHHIEFFKRFRN